MTLAVATRDGVQVRPVLASRFHVIGAHLYMDGFRITLERAERLVIEWTNAGREAPEHRWPTYRRDIAALQAATKALIMQRCVLGHRHDLHAPDRRQGGAA